MTYDLNVAIDLARIVVAGYTIGLVAYVVGMLSTQLYHYVLKKWYEQ